jgi:hypothetical protein
MLLPIYRWIWRDTTRRGRKLMAFAEVEADGGRDLVRAAELTSDPILRRLFLVHASDEGRHAGLFRERGLALLASPRVGRAETLAPAWLAPGERGLDDLRIGDEGDDSLLAFLHLSEKAAARDFQAYCQVLDRDLETRAVFEAVLHDETFHMNYTYIQLGRVAGKRRGWLLWRARLGRVWKAYLRVAAGVAGIFGTVVFTAQYFLILPPFALAAKRGAAREAPGWSTVAPQRAGRLRRQY